MLNTVAAQKNDDLAAGVITYCILNTENVTAALAVTILKHVGTFEARLSVACRVETQHCWHP